MGTWAKASASCPLRSWSKDLEPDRKIVATLLLLRPSCAPVSHTGTEHVKKHGPQGITFTETAASKTLTVTRELKKRHVHT
jgi:hypothetical protein